MLHVYKILVSEIYKKWICVIEKYPAYGTVHVRVNADEFQF